MKQDFFGFQYCGVHTSDLNIVRVSDGSRYSENLSPVFQDKTEQMPGSDGTLYWESFDVNKPWPIQVAFDELSEAQYRRLRQVFNGKAIGELIFDELPFKAYAAKVQSPPQFKTICFDTPDGTRVYKGEGTIDFIAYYPYARSVYKFLNEFNDEEYDNKAQWAAASGMKPTRASYDGTGTTINLYNAGDLETDWQAFYPINSSGSALTSISLNSGVDGQMVFSSISRKKTNDAYIRINSRTNLIEGCDSSKNPTGSLYNEFLVAGDFFKIPLGESTFVSNTGCSEIKYDYLYY